MDDDNVGYTDGTATISSSSASSNAAVLFEEEEKAFQCIRELTVDRIDKNYEPNDRALAQLRKIFDKYLELPSLLDRYIAPMVNELTESALGSKFLSIRSTVSSRMHWKAFSSSSKSTAALDDADEDDIVAVPSV